MTVFLNNFRRHRAQGYLINIPRHWFRSQLSVYTSPAIGTMCPVLRTNILISRIVKVESWHLHVVVTRKPVQLSGHIRILHQQKNTIQSHNQLLTPTQFFMPHWLWLLVKIHSQYQYPTWWTLIQWLWTGQRLFNMFLSTFLFTVWNPYQAGSNIEGFMEQHSHHITSQGKRKHWPYRSMT